MSAQHTNTHTYTHTLTHTHSRIHTHATRMAMEEVTTSTHTQCIRIHTYNQRVCVCAWGVPPATHCCSTFALECPPSLPPPSPLPRPASSTLKSYRPDLHPHHLPPHFLPISQPPHRPALLLTLEQQWQLHLLVLPPLLLLLLLQAALPPPVRAPCQSRPSLMWCCRWCAG
jgi:hypothetical protein